MQSALYSNTKGAPSASQGGWSQMELDGVSGTHCSQNGLECCSWEAEGQQKVNNSSWLYQKKNQAVFLFLSAADFTRATRSDLSLPMYYFPGSWACHPLLSLSGFESMCPSKPKIKVSIYFVQCISVSSHSFTTSHLHIAHMEVTMCNACTSFWHGWLAQIRKNEMILNMSTFSERWEFMFSATTISSPSVKPI